MIRTLFWTIALYFSLTVLIAEEENFTPPDEPFVSSLVKTQNLISTVVNSVSSISGEWIHSDTDMMVLGPEPLILNRCYIGDHAHDDRLGYNWDFNRPHKLIVSTQDKRTQHYQIFARLQQSSGIATIHESSVHKSKLDGIIPMHLSRSQGLTNCRGEISAKTNLHNTIIQLDLKNKQCAAVSGSGQLTYYNFAYQENATQWIPAKIGVGHYKESYLDHYQPLYERKPNGNTYNYGKGLISVSNSDQSEVYGDIKFKSDSLETLKIQASDGKTATYKFSTYYHPVKTINGELRGFIPKRFYLSEVRFSHKPTETYEYLNPPSEDLVETPRKPLLTAKRQPHGRFQEVEYYYKGDNTIDMSSDQERSINIHLGNDTDYRYHRIKVIKEPVGHNAKPVITHRFIYEVDKVYQPVK